MSKKYMQQRGETIRFNEAELISLVVFLKGRYLNEADNRLLAKFERSLERIQAKRDA